MGGKGQNFARAACSVQDECCGVAHFLGGNAGNWISNSLKGKVIMQRPGTSVMLCSVEQGIPQITSWIACETRTCTTLKDLAANTVTEIIDPSGTVQKEEYNELVRLVYSMLPKIKGLAFCGTCPPGKCDDSQDAFC